MGSEEGDVVTAEVLMQRVEALLLTDQLSESEKSEILKTVLCILEGGR
jgi:hypothetical protein